MAVPEVLIQTALDAASPLTAIVSSRHYIGQLPQTPTYPCLLINVFLEPDYTLGGRVTTNEKALIQISAYAETKTELTTIRTPLVNAMITASGFTAIFERHQSISFDESVEVYREDFDFNLWYDVT